MGFADGLKRKQDELPGSVLHEYDLEVRVIVRAMPDAVPGRRAVRSAIMRWLLRMPQFGWDVVGIAMPEESDDQSG